MTMVSAEVRAALTAPGTQLAQLIKAVGVVERALADAPEVVIGLSANVTIDLLGIYLRREAALAGLRARIVMGNYDDPIGDVERFAGEGVERVVMIPFFDNIWPAFEAQAATCADGVLAAKEEELRSRYAIAFGNGGSFKSIQVGLYHRLTPSAIPDGRDIVATLIDRFNHMLQGEARHYSNIQLVDIARSVATVGARAAIDQRFYLRSKAPYSAATLSDLAARLAAGTRGFGTRFLKALAIDCDNTLWGGIVGEDLVSGVKLDPYDYPGNVYWRVQHSLAALEKQGVLLCLCTKNNPADVEDLFARHPHMVLKPSQIVARRVNWTDKVTNLEDLAEELNIGIESFVFLDDSSMEAESVRARLPQVTMIQVPAALPDYPQTMDEITRLFLGAGEPKGGSSKTDQYRVRAATGQAKAAFASHEAYLASLEIEVVLRLDHRSEAQRVAELSQKSNQFNLTTLRYTQFEIEALMASNDANVVSITVRNRFGDSGLTGVLVIRYEGDTALVENFFMSCRVLGQGVEFSLWAKVLARVRDRGAALIVADFIQSAKNAQVSDFYDKLGLKLAGDTGTSKRYSQTVAGFQPAISSWVKVTDV